MELMSAKLAPCRERAAATSTFVSNTTFMMSELPTISRCQVANCSSPHRHRRLAVTHPHPTVLRVARRRISAVLLLQLRQLVGLDRLASGLHVDAEELRRVQAQDLVLHFVGEFRVPVLLD